MNSSPVETHANPGFLTTRWSVVLVAGEKEGAGALSQLCQDYWYPLYAYVRRRGRSVEDAQDLTQAFFLHVIERGLVARARADQGKFRSYLLGAIKHFLANDFRRSQTLKRGGGVAGGFPGGSGAEERYATEPVDTLTPEHQYERSWAFALLERAGSRLGDDYQRAGRTALFETLQPYLAGKADLAGYHEAGLSLGMSASAVAVAVHRMRRRYGELLREEISHTVNTLEEVEEEITYLLSVVARS